MSFSSNGVTLGKTERIRSRIFKIFFRGAEGVLSVLFVISLAVPMVFPRDVHAAVGVSSKLSYQGRLTDTSGNPYTGTYCIRFSIWDVATGGTANPNQLWPSGYATPTSNSVTVSNGVFNVGIGDADALNFDFSTNDTVYLNVEVNQTPTTCSGTWDTLSPRQRMDASPYARIAANVYGTALRTSGVAVGIGAGTGQATPIWLNLDWKNTGTTLGGACPSGSVNGSIWYNSSGTRALSCVNNVVVGLDNASEIASVNITGNTAGTPAAITGGAISFAGGNNLTLSQVGNAITISGDYAHDVYFGGNTSGTMATVSTGSLLFAGGNNITLSQNGNAVTISAGAGGYNAMQFTNSTANSTMNILWAGNSNGSGNITLGLTGSTVTGSAPAGGASPTVSRLMWPANNVGLSNITAPAQGTMSILYFPIGEQLTATRMDVAMSISLNTQSSANTAAVAISQTVGLYSKNANTLMSMSTSSNQQTISWASNTGSYSSITGLRLMSSPININATPGDYYVIYNMSTANSSIGTATTALAPVMSIMGQTMATAGVHATNWGLSATSQNIYGGMGVYASQVATAPGNLSLSAINQTGANVSKANFWVQLRNI